MRRNRIVDAALVLPLAAGLAACGAGGPSGGGGKISDNKIVIGVLTDESGIYSSLAGKKSIAAVRLAIDDFKKKYGDKAVTKNIEVIDADHQNKPDVANNKAQEMYQRGRADMIVDVPNSAAALAVENQAKANKRVFFDTGAATTALTGQTCNKYTFHYGYDTFMLANGLGPTVTKDGGKKWYIVYPDYAFGQDMQAKFTAAVEGAGGSVVGKSPTPFPNDDFSTYLLKAPSLKDKPQVLGAMQAGGDLVNLVKQYNQFGLKDKGIQLAAGLMFITDIHALGPDALAGTRFTEAWYWNFDDRNREWADRFEKATGDRPSFVHAADYSATLQYLEAVQRAGTDGSDKVVGELSGHKFDDFFARNGQIRSEDNLLLHDAYLAQVKPKSDVKEPWDYEKILETIPADKAFGPVDDACKK